MNRSQSKGLRSLFGTLSTLQPASKLDTGLNTAGTILQLAKDAGDAASNVPYVKAVAGILSQIIKIREEIQANKERCGEIIDLVNSKTTIILQSLDAEAYTHFLRGVLRDDLEPYRTQSRLKLYINRGKYSSELQRIERRLNHFGDLFSVKRLVAISVDTRTILCKPMPPTEVIPQALPASPEVIIGPLLGPGGIGKTTIGTTVLHDPRICSAYPTKYFVSSELAPTTDLLEISVAEALAIPQSSRGVDLSSQIIYSIRQSPHPVLLYIDNLETVWEVESEQPKVDRFLEVLSGASSKLAILITMRGTQEPKTSFLWNPMIILGLDTSEFDRHLSGSPLAIKLFALMVKEGDQPSQLLSSWNEHGDTVLGNWGKAQAVKPGAIHPPLRLQPPNRRYWTPCSRADSSHARWTIHLLAVGLYREVHDRLGEANIHQSIGNLQKRRGRLNAAEASFDLALELYREVQNRWGEANTHQSIGNLQKRRGQLDSAEVSFALALELYREVQNRWGEAKTHKSIGDLHERRDRLDDAEASFSSALELYREVHNRLGEASTHKSIGNLHERRNRLDAAEASFSLALELYREVQNRLGEANTHQSIGNLHQRRDRLDAAEASFSLALELYREVHNRLGEANTHKSIGNLQKRRDRLDAAEASFSLALELYRGSRIDGVKRIPTNLLVTFTSAEIDWMLLKRRSSSLWSRVCLRALDVDRASAAFFRALALWNDIHDLWGIAASHHAFGDLYLINNRLEDASTSLGLAFDMYTTQVESRIDEALVNRSLGELHLRREQFDDSERVIRRALELDILADSRVGQAQSHWGLGKLFMTRGNLGSAESSYSNALQLFFEIDDYQATPCLLDLGKVWVLLGRIEEDNGSNMELLRARWNQEKTITAEVE
ncbi:hypothetical protein DL96DRAFT_1821646 [Flagelloscypha sp. PMI_526]|nr:hypothetical protein DL96DRAFT_1821646 [Flagelloscypha sp. PMI_526]